MVTEHRHEWAEEEAAAGLYCKLVDCPLRGPPYWDMLTAERANALEAVAIEGRRLISLSGDTEEFYDLSTALRALDGTEVGR